VVKFHNDGVVQAVTFAYLICWWVVLFCILRTPDDLSSHFRNVTGWLEAETDPIVWVFLSHLYLVGLSKKLGFKFQHLTIQTLTLLSFSRNCRQMETYEMIVVDGRFLPVQRDWFARRDMWPGDQAVPVQAGGRWCTMWSLWFRLLGSSEYRWRQQRLHT